MIADDGLPTSYLSALERTAIDAAIAARLASPNADPGAEHHSRHVDVTNCLRGGNVSIFCSCNHCCLSVCSRCGAYEGGLTSHCPGERVDFDTTQEVFTTMLDFTTQLGWHMSNEGMRLRSPLFERTVAP